MFLTLPRQTSTDEDQDESIKELVEITLKKMVRLFVQI